MTPIPFLVASIAIAIFILILVYLAMRSGAKALRANNSRLITNNNALIEELTTARKDRDEWEIAFDGLVDRTDHAALYADRAKKVIEAALEDHETFQVIVAEAIKAVREDADEKQISEEPEMENKFDKMFSKKRVRAKKDNAKEIKDKALEAAARYRG